MSEIKKCVPQDVEEALEWLVTRYPASYPRPTTEEACRRIGYVLSYLVDKTVEVPNERN